MRKIILASHSPRRAHLLKQIGIPFTVMGSDVPEDVDAPTDPEAHVLTLSRRKAEWAAERIREGVVLGVDTIVVLDGSILGKPDGAEMAVRTLRRLSGRWHRVFSGMTLIKVDRGVNNHLAGNLREVRSTSDFSVTQVKMRTISEEEIARYVATGEPLDKAGAYGIQGKGAVFVERIEGCFYNVVGLPISRFVQMLDGSW
jgi:septum formation protein